MSKIGVRNFKKSENPKKQCFYMSEKGTSSSTTAKQIRNMRQVPLEWFNLVKTLKRSPPATLNGKSFARLPR